MFFFLLNIVFLSLKIDFVSANSADPDAASKCVCPYKITVGSIFFKFGIENHQLLELSPVIMFNPDNTIILLKVANIYVWHLILLDFSLTAMAATLIFISGCGSAISSAKERKSGFIIAKRVNKLY